MRIPALFCPLILFLGLFLHPQGGQATVLIKLELENLVAHADAVVQGEVLSSRSYLTPDGRSIETESILKVEQRLQINGDKDGQTVKVRTLGGKVGDIRMHVPGSPRLKKGQSVLLFLTQRGGHNWVLGMNQGVFDLATGPGGKRHLRQRLGGAALVRKTAMTASAVTSSCPSRQAS